MLSVGQFAPDFELINQNGAPVRLSDYRGKRVVLFTFTRANTPGCTKQACALRDAMPRFAATNDTVVLAMSDDSPQMLKEWKESQHLPYDLLSDPDGKVLDAFGVGSLGFLSLKLPMRPHTLWVLDENGVIRAAHAPVLLADAANAALKALAEMRSPATASQH